MKIFVPDLTSYQCYFVLNHNTIRAYEEQPQINQDTSYRDYYINSHYLYKDGTEHFDEISVLPVCITTENLTDNWYYRNDVTDILFIIFIFCFFCIYLPLLPFHKLFKNRY